MNITMRQLLTLSFFFIFSYSFTYAQVAYTLADTVLAKRLFSESESLEEDSNFDSAFSKADSALIIYEQILGKETKEAANVLELKGSILANKNKIDIAIAEHQKAMDIRIKVLGDKSTKVARSSDYIARCYEQKGDFKKAIEYFQKALDTKLQTLDTIHKSIGFSYFSLSSAYESQGEYDKALESCKKSISIFLKTLPKNDPDLVAFYNNLGIIYFRKAEFEKSLESYNIVVNLCHSIGNEMDNRLAIAYTNICEVYTIKGDNIKGLEFAEKSLNIKLKLFGEIHPSSAISFSNIANIYTLNSDYGKALKYYQKALAIRMQVLDSNHPDIGNNISDIANILSERGEYNKSIEYNEKALAMLIKKLGKDHPNVAVTLNNLALCYNYVGKYDKGIEYAQKSYEIKLEKFGANNPVLATSLVTIGNSYELKKDYAKAIEYFQKALNIEENKLDSNNIQIGKTLQNLGTVHVNMQDYEKALYYFEKATKIFQKGSDYFFTLTMIAEVYVKQKKYKKAEDLLHNTLLSCENENNIFNLNINLIDINNSVAKLEFLQYQQSQNKNLLEQSIKSFNNAINGITYQTSNGSKTELLNQKFSIFESAIKTGLILYNIDKNSSSLKNSFNYNEQIKASSLQAQLKESDALNYANIPDSLIKDEYNSRVSIAFNEKQKQAKRNAGKSETDSTVLAISSKLFDLKQEYETLKQTLEKNYPDYYRLKYDLKTVSVDDVQKKMLSPQQTLLSYFVGDSSIFAFVVKLDTYAVFTIKKDFPLEIYIKQLREGLYGYQTAAVKTEKLYEAKADSFAQAAFMLHQKLIRPLSILLTKEVILVPDGVLGYIPFDVLLSEKPKDATKFNSHHYFGKDHIISYNYSATLWHEMQNKKHKTEPTKNFVGYAPYYNGDTTVLSQIFANDLTMRKGLDSLKYSGEEVFKAQKLMGGESILDKKATKKTFEETASNYRIIHLATHGKANDKAGDYCFLAFTEQKDSIDNELLYVRDIYNLSLNADLVVLSACETGIGELKRGEGIVSLARAFAYSGAKSMVTSLWSVNDKSTMQIMENFYRNLRKGQTKNYALWKAKQDYWEKAKGEFAHPFYWSSFIPIGDMKPVKMLP
jgi:CHAT domain-containing protein